MNKLIFRILYWEINNEEESILFSRHDFPVITPGIRTVRPNLGGRKLRIIVFGAHPDDCEIKTGGTAAMWATGNFEEVVPVPKQGTEREARRKAVRDRFARRAESVANKYRTKLIELYGEEKGKKFRYAEAFELCEYGSRASPDKLKQLFPFFGR